MPGIGWCSNVLSATSVDALCADLSVVVPRLPTGTPVGLWLSASMLQEDLAPLRTLLQHTATPVLGLNAFPCDAFHAAVVKQDVYRPPWGDPARTNYTIAAAEALCSLVPAGSRVGLTTVPIGWGQDEIDHRAAAAELAHACDAISQFSASGGVELHLAIEPEPGCVIGTARELAAFIEGSSLARWAEAGALRACLDACHLAVMHESPQSAVKTLTDAGIRVGRIQLSSCPQAESAADFHPLAEPRWLHQTSCLADEKLVLFTDINDAEECHGVWRCHLHVPVHRERIGRLQTTQPYIRSLLQATAGLPDPPAAEIETYAWSVLAPELRASTLAEDIAGELRWASAVSASVHP